MIESLPQSSKNSGNKRPSWDSYFMEIARLVATRSTCLRRQVGAVFVRDKRILATGYNGVPRGLAHCLDIGCLREKLGIPAEGIPANYKLSQPDFMNRLGTPIMQQKDPSYLWFYYDLRDGGKAVITLDRGAWEVGDARILRIDTR